MNNTLKADATLSPRRIALCSHKQALAPAQDTIAQTRKAAILAYPGRTPTFVLMSRSINPAQRQKWVQMPKLGPLLKCSLVDQLFAVAHSGCSIIRASVKLEH